MSDIQPKIARKPDMSLKLAGLDRPEQFKAWQTISAPIGDVIFNEDSEKDDTPFESNAWNLGRLLLTTTRFPMSTMIRSDRHIQLGSSDYVRLRIFRGGGGNSIVDGQAVDVVPDDIHFVHGRSEVHLTAQADDILGLLIPYDFIDLDPERANRHFCITGGTPTARLISCALETTLQGMPTTAPGDIPLLASALISLVRGMLLHNAPVPAEDQSFRLLQRNAIRQYVDDNLVGKDITVELLCDVFHASRASVYRHFKQDGGLQKYMIERRLDRCLYDLLVAPITHGMVRRAAEQWGFDNASYFNRRFREKFGMTPGAVINMRDAEAATDTVDDVRQMNFPDFAYILKDVNNPVELLKGIGKDT